jgi:hypothetical protein
VLEHAADVVVRPQKRSSIEAAAHWLDQRVGNRMRSSTAIAIADATGDWAHGLVDELKAMGFTGETVAAKLAATDASNALTLHCYRAVHEDDTELNVYVTIDREDSARAATYLTPLYAATHILIYCFAATQGNDTNASIAMINAMLNAPHSRLRRVFLVVNDPSSAKRVALQTLCEQHPDRILIIDSAPDTPAETWQLVLRELDRADHPIADAVTDPAAKVELAIAPALAIDDEIERLLFETLVRTQGVYISVMSAGETLLNACDDLDQNEHWQSHDELLRLQLTSIPTSSLRQLVTQSDSHLRCIAAIADTDGLLVHCVWRSEDINEVVATAHARQLAQTLAQKLADSTPVSKEVLHG